MKLTRKQLKRIIRENLNEVEITAEFGSEEWQQQVLDLIKTNPTMGRMLAVGTKKGMGVKLSDRDKKILQRAKQREEELMAALNNIKPPSTLLGTLSRGTGVDIDKVKRGMEATKTVSSEVHKVSPVAGNMLDLAIGISPMGLAFDIDGMMEALQSGDLQQIATAGIAFLPAGELSDFSEASVKMLSQKLVSSNPDQWGENLEAAKEFATQHMKFAKELNTLAKSMEGKSKEEQKAFTLMAAKIGKNLQKKIAKTS